MVLKIARTPVDGWAVRNEFEVLSRLYASDARGNELARRLPPPIALDAIADASSGHMRDSGATSIPNARKRKSAIDRRFTWRQRRGIV